MGLLHTLNPFADRRHSRVHGSPVHEGDFDDYLVHTSNPYMLAGEIVVDPNKPIRGTPLQVRYPVGITSAARKMMGINEYDGTASELNPNSEMVMDTIDPIWFPELTSTVQPSSMPAVSQSDVGAEF